MNKVAVLLHHQTTLIMKTQTFKQTAKVGVAGSLFNQLMANNQSIPEVGKGATQLHYSDRSCYEVIEVSPDLKTVRLEELDAEAAVKPSPIGHQNWILKPTGRFITVEWKYGSWKRICRPIVFTKEFIEEANDNGFAAVAAYLRKKDSATFKKIFTREDGEPAGTAQKVVEGITRKSKTYSTIKLLFGVKDYYYDWSF